MPASDAASTAYQTWLRQVLEKVRFHNPTIVAVEGKSAKGVYRVFPFRVEATAGLEPVTRFLFEFYSAPHLHQVRRLSLQPLENSKDFKVSLTIEAVSLPTTDRPLDTGRRGVPSAWPSRRSTTISKGLCGG